MNFISKKEKVDAETVFIDIKFPRKKVSICSKAVSRNWDCPQVKKLFLFADILSQKYRSSKI